MTNPRLQVLLVRVVLVVVTVVDWCQALLGKRDGWMDLAGRNFQGQPFLGASKGQCEKMSGGRRPGLQASINC